ncbi:MAG: ABC transporter ATP-binding protein [Bacteroidia bacterium]
MKGFFSTNRGASIRNAIRSIKDHVSAAQKKRLMWLWLLILISAILDVFGLAIMLPIITAATKPELIHTSMFLKPLFDNMHFQSDNNFLLFLIFSLLAFFVFKSAFGLFVNYVQIRLSSEIAMHLSKNQFSKFFSLNFSDFQNLKTADMTKDIVANPNSYVQFIVFSLITLGSELLIVFFIVTGIAIANIQLFVFIVATVGPATLLVTTVIRRKSGEIGAGIDTNFPKAMGEVNQALNGYIDIKLADKENFYRGKYLHYQGKFQWYMMKYYFMNQVPFRTNEVVAVLGVVVIFFYALFLNDGNQEIISLIGLFAAASYRLMPSMNRIVNMMNFLNVNQVAIHNLNHFMDHFRTHQKEELLDTEISFVKEITFKNISFRFPDSDKSIINNLTFTVKKGEKLGFVGSSGSGKTTLMNILLRFYIENSGDVLADGVKLTNDNMKSWRKKIGYVKQDIFLIDGTIRENIGFGEDEIDEARLQKAIKQASLEKFVQSLPEGLNTLIGERGSRLSGGQKQRIGIARSLYRNAEILIFDEATSALDNATEQEVTESIDSLSETNKTIFIIAHRITTLKNCDKIFELKNGEISGMYKYQELVEKVF